MIACKPGLGGAQIPRYCDGGAENDFGANNCGQESFVILPHKSKFSDLQTLKLQVGCSPSLQVAASAPVELNVSLVSVSLSL